jgi:hypothetical protein
MSFSCFIAFYSLHWPGGKAIAPQISANRGMFAVNDLVASKQLW